MLASAVLTLLANAVGLLIAAALLDGFSIDALSLVQVTLVFTVVEVIAGPLLISISIKNLPALRGGIALITTFVGLLVTDLFLAGLSISGISTWILASLVVWLCALLAGILLPLILFKKALDQRDKG